MFKQFGFWAVDKTNKGRYWDISVLEIQVMLNLISDKLRKRISFFLFILAIAFALPPTFPLGEIFTDLLLNIPLAIFITSKTNFSLMTSLLLTYTAIPLLLLLLSSWINPSDTFNVFNGQFIKIKSLFIRYINLIKNNPIHLIWLFISIYLLFVFLDFYQEKISTYLLT